MGTLAGARYRDMKPPWGLGRLAAAIVLAGVDTKHGDFLSQDVTSRWLRSLPFNSSPVIADRASDDGAVNG